MMVALHYEKGNNFSPYWKEYLDANNIDYKIVNCYSNGFFDDLKNCDTLLWHVNNLDYRDQLFAKELLKSIYLIGVKVFPDENTLWHFDDKIAQKYLFQSLSLPLIESYIFYDKKDAITWVEKQTYPKVFKLRKGSGSKAVFLIKSKRQGLKVVSKAFKKGFKTIDPVFMFKERFRKFRLGMDTFFGVIKGFIRIFIGTQYIRMSNREKGYVYFQEFLPDLKYDTRIIVIGNKAFGIKRMVRKDDFKASGSGLIVHSPDSISEEFIKLAFDYNVKLKMQCAAFDFVWDSNGQAKLLEVSFGFNSKAYLECPGYWDKDINWYEKKIEPQIWILENLLNE